MASCVCAEEYELEYRYAYPPTTEGQRLIPMIKPDEKLSAEPKYGSLKPIYVTAKFGNEKNNLYTMVFDESKGADSGYDIIYIDRNNNEDLTDDPPVQMQGYGAIRPIGVINFGPVEILLKYGDKIQPYNFVVQFQMIGKEELQSGSKVLTGVFANLNPARHYLGDIQAGDSSVKIMIEDLNGNGIFNDLYKVQPIETRNDRLYATSDGVSIKYENIDLWQSNFYAKFIQIDKDWYSMDISEDGKKISLEKADTKFGTIRIPYYVETLRLSSENGIITLHSKGDFVGGTSLEFQVPVGVYQLYDYTNLSSLDHNITASGTNSGKKFRVNNGEILDLKIGPPLIINIDSFPPGNIKAGSIDIFSLTFTGQAGEVVTNLQNIKSNLPKPTFKAVDESGKVVEEGSFEYG